MAYFEPVADASVEPKDLAVQCIEAGAGGILLDEPVPRLAFCDLSTGFAGELLHHLSKYGLRLAGVLEDPGVCSPSFKALVREANAGTATRFFRDRAAAIDWLERR